MVAERPGSGAEPEVGISKSSENAAVGPPGGGVIGNGNVCARLMSGAVISSGSEVQGEAMKAEPPGLLTSG